MVANSIQLTRTSTILRPNPRRVLLRLFTPGDSQRVSRIMDRIMLLTEVEVGDLLREVFAEFSERHQQIQRLFLDRFEQIRELLAPGWQLSEQRRLLMGSYFLSEYSLEAAALFNPSLVPHPHQ